MLPAPAGLRPACAIAEGLFGAVLLTDDRGGHGVDLEGRPAGGNGGLLEAQGAGVILGLGLDDAEPPGSRWIAHRSENDHAWALEQVQPVRPMPSHDRRLGFAHA